MGDVIAQDILLGDIVFLKQNTKSTLRLFLFSPWAIMTESLDHDAVTHHHGHYHYITPRKQQ